MLALAIRAECYEEVTMEMKGTASDVNDTSEDWRTRPEPLSTFLFSLVLCLIFPIIALWYGPRYAMRHEYFRAIACVAVPVTAIAFLSSQGSFG